MRGAFIQENQCVELHHAIDFDVGHADSKDRKLYIVSDISKFDILIY